MTVSQTPVFAADTENMEPDLTSRHAKWTHEQHKRREQARRKIEMEARKRAAAVKAQAELETLQQQKRIARIAELERQEQVALDEQRLTGGIAYRHQLRPFPTTEDGDKITLPVSTLAQLDPQNAMALGVFTFELSFGEQHPGSAVSVTRQTHAGVLEFTAEEGTVGLPPKVAASLFVSTNQLPSMIHVHFVRLEKGTFARLQPRGDGFGARQLDFKLLLERSLKTHTTLTEGDVLLVRHGRETFEVLVAKLEPERAVNIVNTDLEVDLLPCEAEATKLEAEQRVKDEAKRAVAVKQEIAHWKATKMATLVPEPAIDETLQVKVVLRMPEGQQTRRFCHSSLLYHVFEYVEALMGDKERQFQLVATYPRRVFGLESANKSLQELGLHSRQVVLFVEHVTETEPEVEVTNEKKGESVRAWTQLSDAWREARQTLETRLDERLHSTAGSAIHAMEPIMPIAHSTDREMKWQAQLNELEEMGFANRALNIDILERYQGRLLRVVNFLSDLGTHRDGSSNTTVDHQA